MKKYMTLQKTVLESRLLSLLLDRMCVYDYSRWCIILNLKTRFSHSWVKYMCI